MTGDYREGYEACKKDLQDIMNKTFLLSSPARMIAIMAFLMDNDEIHRREE